ncbi:MAG: DNA polymerase III subunit alpha, partial [Flavobacteriales bacterium]
MIDTIDGSGQPERPTIDLLDADDTGMSATDNNTRLSKLPQSEEALPDEIMLPAEELKKRFAAYPRILENSRRLPQRSAVSFDFKPGRRHQNQCCYTGNADLDFRLLRKLCYDGLPYRYTRMTSQITHRLEMELSTIRQQHFVSYFLITWKIVKYARERGCFYVGRGSGANSIVSYLLRITDVDPIELDLYFERFINLFRQSPPDFDIDFSWKDRRDVTAFIFRRFAHTALLATYNTFQYKAVIRELGKVFGLPADEIIKLQKEPHKADETGKLILRYSRLIRDFPSHLSVHAGGIIIAEKPITYYTATFLPPKGFPTTRFDMITAEDVGLYKWDILGQRGLAKIRDALEIIRENRPDEPPIDIHDVRSFYRKEKINRLLKSARAIGCFYIESPAMRMLLKKLDVDSYRGLVAASSVIRPGVARSGMMREYIIRHRFPEKRREAHPVLLQLMPETYGVMVYQEDVIKVAHHFAGLSPAEADVLRRGMSGKFRSREEFLRVQEKFFSNCRKKGYKEAMIQDVWRQIESFAGYA